MYIYTLYDTVAEESGPLFEAINDATAARSAAHVLKDVESPDDYKLICVGKVERYGQAVLLTSDDREINVSFKISKDKGLALVDIDGKTEVTNA